MSYTHFTLEERRYLQELLEKGYGIRKIAVALGRSPSSVSRELRRNYSKTKNRYHHWRAHILYGQRRKNQDRATLHPGTEAWEFVVNGLLNFWSPEQICGRWKAEHPQEKPLSVSTIYRYIKQKKFPNITARDNLRRRGKRKVPRSSNFNTIQTDLRIPDWPDEIRNRTRFGDWEGDTIHGGQGKGLLISLVDRKTRYLRLGLLRNKNAEEAKLVICRLLQGFPVHSISFDNGSEFAEFRAIEKALSTVVYFAEPHKPWQRGTNENTNDLVRFFFPKGFDFRNVTDEDVQRVESLINHRPRKCLSWRKPLESLVF